MHWHGDFATDTAHTSGSAFIHSFCINLQIPDLAARIMAVGDILLSHALERNVRCQIVGHRLAHGDTIALSLVTLPHGIMLIIRDTGGQSVVLPEDFEQYEVLATFLIFRQMATGLLMIAFFEYEEVWQHD